LSDQKKDAGSTTTGKGRATPTRKEREAANLKPLVGNRSKESRANNRIQQREARLKARAAMMAGDEKYLLGRDQGPQRKIAREIIDGRYTLIEGLMPLMVLFLLVTSVTTEAANNIITLVMILALVVVSVEATLMHRIIASRIKEKLGGTTKMQKGTWFYVFTRGMQPRPLRIPKPAPRRNKK
jgi:hypothetical protein